MQGNGIELDDGTREVRLGQMRVRLQDQPFEILRLLLERPGAVVTRAEFHARLWPGETSVDVEHSLNAAVKRLRVALGDDAIRPRFVETVPRRGYRFIGQVETPAGHGPVHAESRPRRARLAVLPFTDLTPEGSPHAFCDGLTEETIAQIVLVCGSHLGVVARWSSMAFKDTVQRVRDIGALLAAEYVIEGSVRCVGARVRIAAGLVQTTDETLLSSVAFDEPLSPALSAQSGGAARIAQLARDLVPNGGAGADRAG